MNSKIVLGLGLSVILTACSATKGVHKKPVAYQKAMEVNIPAKKGIMSEEEIQKWSHADISTDSIPGMSIEQAYEFVANKKGTTVVVAVIDSGIDIDHEDLKDNIWINSDEIAGNGKDDDSNGYIDDVNGWNFLGGQKGKSTPEQLEITRIYGQLNSKYNGKPEEDLSKKEKKEYAYYKEIEIDFNEMVNEDKEKLGFYKSLEEGLKSSDANAQKKLNKSTYSMTDLQTLPKEDQHPMLVRALSTGLTIEEMLEKIVEGVDHFQTKLDVNFNVAFDGRSITGDNPYDYKDKKYGNAFVVGSLEDEMHGTHVSGITLATRDNGVGMNGVSNNVKLMTVRAVPDGDEYDKDVALAIRYAVDNGAKVINMSFGKSYSTNPEWVYKAIKYAAKKDVLLVNAAGNDSKNIDKEDTFPTDAPDKVNEIADNVLTIGSMTRNYNKNLVSTFSNYGKLNVDIFAPGSEIYSTIPNNEYDTFQGTSMAAPAVAGVAALIRSYYPELSASQVKHIIMNSGTKINFDVILPDTKDKMVPFSDLSVSGNIINAYNALVLADRTVNGK